MLLNQSKHSSTANNKWSFPFTLNHIAEFITPVFGKTKLITTWKWTLTGLPEPQCLLYSLFKVTVRRQRTQVRSGQDNGSQFSPLHKTCWKPGSQKSSMEEGGGQAAPAPAWDLLATDSWGQRESRFPLRVWCWQLKRLLEVTRSPP